MRSLFFSFLLSAGVALTAGNPASAAPLSAAPMTALSGAGQSGVLLVRDGCGRGRHFSKWRGVCVWNGRAGPAYRVYAPPVYAPPVYGYGYGYYGPPVYGPYGYGYGFYRRW